MTLFPIISYQYDRQVYYVHDYFPIYRKSFCSSVVQLFFFLFNLRNLPEGPWEKLIKWQDGKERMMFLQADRLRVLSEKPPLRQGTHFLFELTFLFNRKTQSHVTKLWHYLWLLCCVLYDSSFSSFHVLYVLCFWVSFMKPFIFHLLAGCHGIQTSGVWEPQEIQAYLQTQNQKHR